jgi:hypothetical protein
LLYEDNDRHHLPHFHARYQNFKASMAIEDGRILAGGHRYRTGNTLRPVGALACLLGENRDIFFPKLSEKLHLITFAEIARRYLRAQGFEPYACASEDEARARVAELVARRQWPCYFFASDTTGGKNFEEFFTERETRRWTNMSGMGGICMWPRKNPRGSPPGCGHQRLSWSWWHLVTQALMAALLAGIGGGGQALGVPEAVMFLLALACFGGYLAVLYRWPAWHRRRLKQKRAAVALRCGGR